MARRTAKSGLSPTLLKHFAGATAALTVLLAVFASGEDWGARAQVNAVEAKNQLAATEAEKLGTRKVAKTLKVANNVGAARFGDDEREVFSGGGGYAPSVSPLLAVRPTLAVQRRPGSPLAGPPDPTRPPQPPGNQQEPAQLYPSAPPAPSSQDLANITASSAMRSGGSRGGD